MSAKNTDSLLGKKHEKSPCKEENDISSEKDDNNSKKLKTKQIISSSKTESDSPSNENEKSKHSLLDIGNEKYLKEGLLGEQNNLNEKPKSLFNDTAGSIFSNIFGGKSLLFDSRSEPIKEVNLFSGDLIDFSKINKKENEENSNDNICRSKSISPRQKYNPEEEKEKESKDGFKKKYVKRINDIFFLDKKEQKFVSKGEGFLSIEIQEMEKEGKNERYAILMFRNIIGGIIFEGILDSKMNKFDTYEKELKKVCHIFFLIKGEENVMALAQAKIPFNSDEEVKEFEDKYNNAIKYIKKEIEDF